MLINEKTILMVEDEAIISLSTSKILQKNGFNVITANKGEKAIALIADSNEIDLVLMDINLGPGIDGVETAAEILKLKHLPIIFLTSHSEKEIVDKIKTITSYGYVIKNSGEFVLLESINMALTLFDANKKLLKDINKREYAEKKLKISESKFSTIFHSSPAGICINDMESALFVDVNEAFCEITGYEKSELLGHDPVKLNFWCNSEDYKFTEELLKNSGKISNVEIKFRKKNGLHGYAMISCEMIELDCRNCVLTLVNDLTESKEYSKALTESQSRFRSFFNNVESIVWIKDREGRFIDINEYTEKHLHMERSFIIGKTVNDLFPDDHAETYAANDNEVMNSGKLMVFEESAYVNDEEHIYLSTKFPLQDQYGRFNSIGAICTDITNFKRIERENSAVFEAVPDLLFKISRDGVLLDYKCADTSELYRPPEDFLGKKMHEVIPVEIADRAMELINRALDIKSTESFEYSLEMNGETRSFEDRLVPVSGENVLSIVRDITRRKIAESALTNREEILSVITVFAEKIFTSGISKENINFALAELGKIFNLSRTYIFTKISESDDEIVVKQVNEWCAENVFSAADVLDLERFAIPKNSKYGQRLEDMLNKGYLSAKISEVSEDYERTIMDLQNLKSYLFIPIIVNNSWWGMIGFDECRFERTWLDYEIDALKTASNILGGALQNKFSENNLADSRQLYYTLVNSSPDSVSVTDLDGILIFSSQKALELFGYGIDENTDGMSVFSFVSPQYRDHAIGKFSKIIYSGTPNRDTFILRRKDDSEFYAEISASRYDDGAGNPKGLIIVTRDISEIMKTRKALEEEAISRKILIEGSNDGIVVINENGKVADVNRKFCEMLGYTPMEMKEMHVCQWDDKFRRCDLEQMIQAVDEKGDFFETVHKRKDGSRFEVEVSSNAATVNGKKLIFCVCRDITKRNAAQKKIKESEEHFSRIFQTSPVGISINRISDGAYIDVNDALLNIGGYTREEVIGRTTIELNVYDEKTRKSYMKRLKKDGKINNEEIIFIRKDGTTANVIISMELIEINGEMYILGTAIDVTDKKQSQEELLKSLNEKNILLKELQHRVKNNLTVISSLLNLEMGNLSDDNSRNIFQNSITRINSLSSIYEQLYSTDDISRIDLNIYLSNLIESLVKTYKINENIVLVTSIKEGSYIDLKRSVLIGLIFNELLTNSMKYAYPSNGKGIINAGFNIVSGTAMMYVKDEGCGIPADYNIDSAKSLGLKLVKMLTEQLDGTLEIRSEKGTFAGVKFSI